MLRTSLDAPRPGEGGWRLLRAAVLGGSSLLLASGAHLLGGGGVPNAAVLVLAFCLAGLVAVSVTARRCRLPSLLAVLGVEQTGLHLLFGSTAANGVCSPVAVAPLHGVHAEALCTSATGHPGMAPTGLSVALVHQAGLSMVLAHLVALLVTAWLLARGERWVWGLVAVAAAAVAARPTRRRPRPVRQLPTWLFSSTASPLLQTAPTRGPPQR